MSNKREAIDTFLSVKKFAIAGVSRNENKTGSAFLKELTGKGLDVVGVNPHMKVIHGKPCFPSVSELPDGIESILTTVKPEQTLSIVKEAYKKGINNIWMQQGSASPEAIQFAENNKMNVIYKECIMMYCDPVKSVHKFHRGIKKIFGGYHKALA
ncbi:MAG: CoA-binding protein [Spirochaetaceae bacterium]